MTKNELKTIDTSNFSVDFQPATIEIENFDIISQAIDSVAEHYSNTVYEEDDLQGLQQSHKELNSLRNGLNESRLEVKREYNKPLNKFEDKIKDLVTKIDNPLNEIKRQRDDILTAQKELREEALQDYIERQIKDTKIDFEDVEIKSNWANKGNWTDKMNPRKPLKDELEAEINRIKEENKKLLAEKELLTHFFEAEEIDPAGWISQLEFREATDIIKEYQRDKAREEQLAKEQVEKELERQKQEFIEQEKQVEQAEKIAEEVTEPEETMSEMLFEEEKITNTIEVTGTIAQLSKLNDFLVSNDIEVKQVK